MTFDRDLFSDFNKDGRFKALLGNLIGESVKRNGLFGYTNFRDLEKLYMHNFADGNISGADDSPSALLQSYANFVNAPLGIRELVNIITVSNRRSAVIDHSILAKDITPVSPWDVASSDVINVGKEARLLMLHKLLNHTDDNYMFQMISMEYLRVVINKFDYTTHSTEAIDIIAGLAVDVSDRDIVLLLLFAVYTFTCVKTFGNPVTNSKQMAEVALQLCGTGVGKLDYYLKRIYIAFKDVDLVVNYNLLHSIYATAIDMVYKCKDSIYSVESWGTFKHTFSSMLKAYLTFESSTAYELDDSYFKMFTAWKDHGILPKGDIRDTVRYIKVLRKDNGDSANLLKTVLDHEHGLQTNLMFVVLNSILEFSPDLDSVIDLYHIPIMANDAYVSGTKRTTSIFTDNVGDVLRNLLGVTIFTEMPAWKHCLLILTFLRIDRGLPMDITVNNMTDDIRREITFYYNLYQGVESGTPYKFMLSP